MSIPLTTLPTPTGVRLRQLHDVALASPPATTALPLLYVPTEGRWKARQIGTDGIADEAITLAKLGPDVVLGGGGGVDLATGDARWVNVTGDTMSNSLSVDYSGVPRISNFRARGSLQRPALDFERFVTTVGTIAEVPVGSTIGTLGFSASSATLMAYGGAIYGYVDAPISGGAAPIAFALYQTSPTYAAAETHRFDSYGRYFLNPPADVSAFATTPGLIVNSKVVGISATGGNSLTWNADGFYVSAPVVTDIWVNTTGDTMTGLLIEEGAAAATVVHQTRVALDAQPRFTIRADGRLDWGGGSVAVDVPMYRVTAGDFRIGANFSGSTNNTRDLGFTTVQWKAIYGNALYLSGDGTSAPAWPASGAIRLRNAATGDITWRNAAGSGNLTLGVTSGDVLTSSAAIAAPGGTLSGDLTIESTLPSLVLRESDAAANNRVVKLTQTDAVFRIQAYDDAGTAGGAFFQIARSGNNLSTTSFPASIVTTQANLHTAAAPTQIAIQARISGDTQYRFKMQADGQMEWGPGGLVATDTSLRRAAANEMHLNAHWNPLTTNLYDLGTTSLRWRKVWATNANLSGSLDITNALSVGGAALFIDSANIWGNLDVSGYIQGAGIITAQGELRSEGDLNVANLASIDGGVVITQGLAAYALDVTGDVTVDLGNVSVNGTVGVSGLISALGGLGVTGTSTMTGNVLPNVTNTRDLGSTALRWRKLWAVDGEFTNVPTVGGVALPTAAHTHDAAYVNASGDTMSDGLVIVQNLAPYALDVTGDVTIDLGDLAVNGNFLATGVGQFNGALTVQSKLVGVSATGGNVLAWNSDGFYVAAGAVTDIWVNTTGDTMTGALAINMSTAVATGLTLRGGAASDNTQLRFKGNASNAEQWSIGNMISTNGTGRLFEIYDLAAGSTRLSIDSAGIVTVPNQLLSTRAGGGIDNIELRNTSGTTPVWQMGIQGTALNVTALGNFVMWNSTGGHVLNITPTSTVNLQGKLTFPNTVVDDKITFYTGYTIGIRGGTLGYFVGTGAAHRFYVNNVDTFAVSAAQTSVNSMFTQAGGYAYLGGYNAGASIYPRAGNDVAIGWNFMNGFRDMSFWNTDTANSEASSQTSFFFRQLTGASSYTKLLRLDSSGVASFYSNHTSLPILAARNQAETVIFGVAWDGAIYTSSAAEPSYNPWGAAPAAALRKIKVLNSAGTYIGYIPIYA